MSVIQVQNFKIIWNLRKKILMPIKQKLGIQMFMFAGDEDLIQNLWKLP